MRIGKRIQAVRTEKAISREDVAQAVGIDPGYLADIEEERTDPGVSELLSIARALGTDISAFLYGKEYDEKTSIVTRQNSRVKVERARLLKYESLAPRYAGRHMEPFIIDVFPDSDSGPDFSRHPGEEFHYVMSGILKITVADKTYELEPGDSIYFDSSLPHALCSLTDKATIIAMIYERDDMLRLIRGSHLRNLIQGAKLFGEKSIAVAVPNEPALEALSRALSERVIKKAYLVGDRRTYPFALIRGKEAFEFIQIDGNDDEAHLHAAKEAVRLCREGTCQMIMKGGLNTAIFLKPVLSHDQGLGTGRRLSHVGIFEIPGIDRLVFLSDPAINPSLIADETLSTATDIINNAIDVAIALGVSRPKVAILDANELPTAKIPSSLFARRLSERDWGRADVYGPLSYDLALYPQSVEHKGLEDNPVAGKADILIVPDISGGNFIYKAWAMTLALEAANVVAGARIPVILTSRSDSDMTKFLTICASSIYYESMTKQ